MEYAQKRTSPLLAQILAQMQQNQQYQPQSWGALAAGLGTAALDQSRMNEAMKAEEAQRAAQQKALVQALGQYGQEAGGGPINMPSSVIDEGGTRQNRDIRLDTLPDPAGARSNLLASLIGNESPMAQAGAGALFQQQIMGTPAAQAQSPAGKLRADLGAGIITKEDFKRETEQTSALPNEVKLAQFLFPDDENKQREFLQKKASSELPAQVQMALWASDGDEGAARKLVLENMKKNQSTSLGEILAPALQKMMSGEKLSKGEQAAMDWYKQNPLAALFAILGAKAGTTVEE